MSVLARLASDVPVTPDAETARRWATEELLGAEYHQQASLFSRLLDWLAEQLAGLRTPAALDPLAVLAVVGVVVAVVVVAFLVAGPVRLSRRGASSRNVLAEDDVRTAEQIRAAADAAAARGDWALAVLERYRAVVRGLEERAVLEERAARTAHEAALAAAARLPDLGADLVSAGRTFDDVAYGDVPATADDERRLRELDQRVRGTRAAGSGTAQPAVAAPR
ncbi:DUF4129 domain-containing protein [Cellulomonas fengjieae]|uniref:DUF4129 domain-containing protein n=1 Tax=Cellulomonas fengjieae TaxID=2819978 RepID=A0ABS3SE06_9CELL|nr:DUF4129 domain-containing protein [Cellulomonas fengjieae]MBO3083882.1 DUF4129 domain-containing protein [Cellulomonas fengjieae]MBO3101366.1 DUF4129 domain-containing protein [Cellulomonas fengjieae]QVI64835.1 DUF4129 domain-containing protein [Cellulomonas fengjieae]